MCKEENRKRFEKNVEFVGMVAKIIFHIVMFKVIKILVGYVIDDYYLLISKLRYHGLHQKILLSYPSYAEE